MRPFGRACALLFLVGCQRLPSVAPTATTTLADDGGVPPAAATPNDPATGVTALPDAGANDGRDGGTTVSVTDMTAVPSLCANQIDPGTHNAVALRGDDRELFYIPRYANADARQLRAVAKDGVSPPRTLAVVGHDTSQPWDVALDGNDVYVENGYTIWRVSKAGGTPAVVYTVPSGGTDSPTYAMYQLVVDATNLYWRQQTGYGSPAVWYMPKSGGSPQLIGGDASHIAVGGETLYGAYGTDLWARAVGTSGATFYVSRAAGAFVLAADATRAILMSSDRTINAVAADGSVTPLAPYGEPVRSAAIYNGIVYLEDDHAVRRIHDGVADPIFTATSGGLGPDLVVDDKFVYTQTICNIARIPR
jgi:hypothetical protein